MYFNFSLLSLGIFLDEQQCLHAGLEYIMSQRSPDPAISLVHCDFDFQEAAGSVFILHSGKKQEQKHSAN